MTTPSLPPPSTRRLVRTTLAAVALAAVILVAFVLPAEYAIDPLRTGRMLGLTRISAPVQEPPPPAAPPNVYRSDAATITIDPYDYVEYKYRLEKGATMVFAWQASATLAQDFHSAPDGAGDAGEVSIEKSIRRESSGTLTAPSTGLHGWFWENTGSSPVTVRIVSAGFYTQAVESRSNRTKQQHPLKEGVQ